MEVEPTRLEVLPSPTELDVARVLVCSARARWIALTGPGGMIKALPETVVSGCGLRGERGGTTIRESFGWVVVVSRVPSHRVGLV